MSIVYCVPPDGPIQARSMRDRGGAPHDKQKMWIQM